MVTRNRWKILIWGALVFSIQGAFAGEAWLVITSDPPGAAVSVDNAYRGVTPQRPSDTLRIQVLPGTREVFARKKIAGKEYAARLTIEALGGKENRMQLNLREETARASATPAALPVETSKPRYGTVIRPGNLEVPGRNF